MSTRTHPQTALGSLLYGQPCLTALSADLKKRTITLELPPDATIKGGRYVVLEEAEARAAMAADEALVTFPGGKSGLRVHVMRWLDDLAMELSAPGRSVTLYYQRGHDPDRPASSKPGTWWGSESMTDAAGREWSRSLGRLVMDDFGFLVEVPR
jgi:hypothetical protein